MWNLYHVLTGGGERQKEITYGDYNRCLHAIFPSNRWFQVLRSLLSRYYGSETDVDGKINPQYPLRPTTRNLFKVSAGSEGNLHANQAPGSKCHSNKPRRLN